MRQTKNPDRSRMRQRFLDWVTGENARREPDSTMTNLDELAPAREKKRKTRETPPENPRRVRAVYRTAGVLISVTLMAVLIITALGMPPSGDPNTPAMNEVPERYVEKGTEETGAVNTVAGMILDYRAFDTFGESTVLFAATSSVTYLMRTKGRRVGGFKKDPGVVKFASPYSDMVFRRMGAIIFPFIMMFGIYVILNGHLSPGGGFSGGAVLGGGLILCSLVVGQERMRRILSPERNTKIMACCLLAYAAMKSYSFYTGANHVGWEVPLGTPGALLSSGFILPLNICVGIIVAGTIFSFYMLFSMEEE